MSLFALFHAKSKEKKDIFLHSCYACQCYRSKLMFYWQSSPPCNVVLPFKLPIENDKHPYFEWRGEGGGFFCFLKSSYLSTTHNFVKDCGLKNFNHNLILTCNIYIFIHLIKHKETPGCPSPAPSFMIAFCILDKYLWASHILLPLGLKEREMTATQATFILDTVSLDRWRTKLGNHQLRKHAIL